MRAGTRCPIKTATEVGIERKKVTFSEYVPIYSAHRIDISEGALEQMEVSARHADRWSGNKPISKWDVQDVAAFIRERSKCVSATTANNNRGAILTLWRNAYENRHVEVPAPAVSKLRVKTLRPTAWSPDELSRLCNSANRAPKKRSWTSNHWLALILSIYDTAHRVSCLLRLEWDHIDLSTRTICIPGEIQKSGRDSVHRISPQLVDLLHSISDSGSKYVFNWPYCKRQLWIIFRRDVLVPSGLAATRRDLFHKIRRTSITFVWREAGSEAARRHATHRDVSTTARHYVDESEFAPNDCLDSLPRVNVS